MSQKDVLDLDRILAAAYQHGEKHAILSYGEDRVLAAQIRDTSGQFLLDLLEQQLQPAAWRTFVRELGVWTSTTEKPGPRTELSPPWEPLYTVNDLLLAFKLGLALGRELDPEHVHQPPNPPPPIV